MVNNSYKKGSLSDFLYRLHESSLQDHITSEDYVSIIRDKIYSTIKTMIPFKNENEEADFMIDFFTKMANGNHINKRKGII